MTSRLSKLVFLYVLIATAYFFQGPSANVNSRLDLALALTEDGSVQIDRLQKNTMDKSFHDNHYYSDKAPGLSFLAAVVLFVTKPVFQALNLAEEKDFLAKLYLVCFVLLSIFTAWTATRFFHLALEILGTKNIFLPFALTLLCFTGTLVFAYSTLFFAHQMVGNVLFLSFYYLRQIPKLNRSQTYLVASMIAFACLLEYTVSPLFAGTYAYLFYRVWKREKFLSLIPLAVVSLILGWYNIVAFGAPWSIGYGNLHGSQFESGMNTGFFGMGAPSWTALFGVTFSEYRGLFYYNPIFIFSFLSIVFIWKNRAKRSWLFPCFASFVFLLIANSCYVFWNGGACFGPRHMVPSLILLFVPILMLPEDWLRKPLFWTIGLVGLAYDLIATSVVLIPDEKYPSPFWEYLFPLFQKGILATNKNWPVAYYLEHGTSGKAFNLGQLLGIKGSHSLLPLFTIQASLLILAWYWSRIGKTHPEQA